MTVENDGAVEAADPPQQDRWQASLTSLLAVRLDPSVVDVRESPQRQDLPTAVVHEPVDEPVGIVSQQKLPPALRRASGAGNCSQLRVTADGPLSCLQRTEVCRGQFAREVVRPTRQCGIGVPGYQVAGVCGPDRRDGRAKPVGAEVVGPGVEATNLGQEHDLPVLNDEQLSPAGHLHLKAGASGAGNVEGECTPTLVACCPDIGPVHPVIVGRNHGSRCATGIGTGAVCQRRGALFASAMLPGVTTGSPTRPRPRRRIWRLLLIVAAVLVILVGVALVVVPRLMQPGPRPLFQMPVGCGETWQIGTYPGHGDFDVDLFPIEGEPWGQPVLASYAGTVTVAGINGTLGGRTPEDPDGPRGRGGGYWVKIDHGGWWETQYLHLLEPPMVEVGQRVAQGEQIGRVGSTGNSGAPHLHYEQRRRWQKVETHFDGVPSGITHDDAEYTVRLTSNNCE